MPDLGKYAAEVLSSYGISLALILGLVALSIFRSRRVRASLAEIEARSRKNG
jgi:heme exporter protein D